MDIMKELDGRKAFLRVYKRRAAREVCEHGRTRLYRGLVKEIEEVEREISYIGCCLTCEDFPSVARVDRALKLLEEQEKQLQVAGVTIKDVRK